jgi:hypothetical protein
MITALPALTVSTIFLVWNACRREKERRQRLLCERVAHMLWVAANHDAPPRRRPTDTRLPRRLHL